MSAAPATEHDYYRTILEGAHALGWRAVHFRPALTAHGYRTAVMGDGKGWPDWMLVHPIGGVVFVEVKRDGVKLDPEQVEWRDALRAAGAVWELLHVPSDLAAFWVDLSERSHRRGPYHPLIRDVMAAADEHRGEW